MPNDFFGVAGSWSLVPGKCLEVMKTMPDASVDAVVTDPPYDLTAGKKGGSGQASVNLDSPYGRSRISTGNGGFMGKDWDATGVAFDPNTWCEVLRVLKPGGHLLAFGGSRTWHRLVSAVEDAGFEIRDSIAWLYGSGFPKSLDVSKAIAKAAAPATEAAQQWQGWGTALKPAFEPIVVARKPLAGTVAANVLEHGTGALNIDACRTAATGESHPRIGEKSQETRYADKGSTNFAALPGIRGGDPAGRWPTNVTLDESQAAELDAQTGILTSGRVAPGGFSGEYKAEVYGKYARNEIRPETVYGDSGGASRFFPVFKYQAKAPTRERPKVDGVAHPTVKPLGLMRWLVRLVTPPGGIVLEPFAGSGTTIEAAVLEGFRAFGIEQADEYIPLILKRMGFDRESLTR